MEPLDPWEIRAVERVARRGRQLMGIMSARGVGPSAQLRAAYRDFEAAAATVGHHSTLEEWRRAGELCARCVALMEWALDDDDSRN